MYQIKLQFKGHKKGLLDFFCFPGKLQEFHCFCVNSCEFFKGIVRLFENPGKSAVLCVGQEFCPIGKMKQGIFMKFPPESCQILILSVLGQFFIYL